MSPSPETDVLRGAPRPPPTPLFAPGEVIGDCYEILEMIGCGGMGQVFEAQDRVLNRRVAIKASRIEPNRPSLVVEAQALAAVRHPGMVAVHGFGRHRNVEYIVEERIYGIRLSEHLRQRASEGLIFTINEVLDVLGAICDALAAVHRAGLAHRDVTPANIMLAPGNRIVLMDFGVSLAEVHAQDVSTISGTPQYIAPETIRTAIQPGGAHLVDVYAVGVIGFEMLVGAVPFDGTTIVEILTKQLHAKLPSLEALRPDVPPRLATIIREMVAKDPEDRPQSIEAVRWQLRAIQLKQDERARPAPLSILIVDDEPDVLDLLEARVRTVVPDADVHATGDPEGALQLAQRLSPDLLLLDLEMRPVNGIEVAMYLRGTHLADHCVIALVSARARPKDVDLLRQLGVRHFFTKGPDLPDRIAQLVRSLRR